MTSQNLPSIDGPQADRPKRRTFTAAYKPFVPMSVLPHLFIYGKFDVKLSDPKTRTTVGLAEGHVQQPGGLRRRSTDLRPALVGGALETVHHSSRGVREPVRARTTAPARRKPVERMTVRAEKTLCLSDNLIHAGSRHGGADHRKIRRTEEIAGHP